MRCTLVAYVFEPPSSDTELNVIDWRDVSCSSYYRP